MAQYDINLREYWRILKKRKFIVIFTAVVLGFFSTFFAILRAPTPIYSAACSIRIEKETTVEGLYAKTISWTGGDDIETQLSVIGSYSVLREVAEKMGLVPRRGTGQNEELNVVTIALVERLQAKVAVSRESYTNILNITVTDTNAAFAQKLANTIALTYKEIYSKRQLKRTSEAIKYIEDQLETVRRKLRESEEAFNRFSQENQLISIDLQSENLLARAQAIQNEIWTLLENRRELEGVLHRLERFVENPSGSDQSFYSAKAGNRYQTTNDALVSLVLSRDTLLEDFTPRHPEVIDINRKIAENARKMVILLELQIQNLRDKEADLTAEAEKIGGKTNVLMEKKLEYDRLKRKVGSYNDMTALLERKNQEALIRQAEKPEEISIVRPALRASAPINPPKTTTTGALGVLIGLILGLVTAFIVETFDTSLGAIEDVEETLGAQVLGVVPHADAKEVQESLAEQHPEGATSGALLTPHLVSHFSPNSMIAESFRALRTNIQFKGAENKVKTLAVTSASPQEGKTLVSINLAITMAQAGMKTLLVGSDMRKPMLSRMFGVEMGPGLTDILMGNHPWQDTVKTITDLIMGRLSLDEIMMTPGLDNLHLITSGAIPPNPAILIESRRLEAFIEEAEQIYDLIIFDSPPILSTADAAILGAKMDGVLLVYRVGSVSKGLLKRASTQLEQVNCNILGVILNGMKPEISPDFQDFKYYKYYYSYGGEEKKGKGKKNFFSFLRGKGADRGEEKGKEPSGGSRGQRKERTAKPGKARAVVMILALVLLGTALLWQNGLIDPFRWFGLNGPAQGVPVRPATKTAVKPSTQTAGKPATKTAVKPATQTADRPATQTAVKPATQTAGKPATQTAVKPATQTAVKPATQTAGKPATQTAGKPATQTAGKEGPVEKTPVVVAPASTRAVQGPEPPSPATEKGEEGDKGPASPAAERPLAAKRPEPAVNPRPAREGKKEVPAISEQAGGFPYALYLGSYRTLDRAKKAVAIFGKKGLSPYWAMVDFKEKGIWYRVYAGLFREQQEAQRRGEERGLKEIVVKNTRYANLVGVYGDAGEAETGIKTLGELGYAPYAVRDPEGKSRILVGAYITREGAERQYQELEADGVRAEIVLR